MSGRGYTGNQYLRELKYQLNYARKRGEDEEAKRLKWLLSSAMTRAHAGQDPKGDD